MVFTVNCIGIAEDDAVEMALVTIMFPVPEAPFGSVAVIDVLLLTTKAAAVPLMVTPEVPVKFDPVMVMEVPVVAHPEVGVKLEIAGAAQEATDTETVLLVVELPEHAELLTFSTKV